MNFKVFYSGSLFRKLCLAGVMPMALLCSGCISVGHEFPAGQVSAIRIGETTQQDISNMFGKPVKTGFLDNGMKTWTYSDYQYNLFEDDKTEDLVIRFDKRGVVSSFNYNTNKRSK